MWQASPAAHAGLAHFCSITAAQATAGLGCQSLVICTTELTMPLLHTARAVYHFHVCSLATCRFCQLEPCAGQYYVEQHASHTAKCRQLKHKGCHKAAHEVYPFGCPRGLHVSLAMNQDCSLTSICTNSYHQDEHVQPQDCRDLQHWLGRLQPGGDIMKLGDEAGSAPGLCWHTAWLECCSGARSHHEQPASWPHTCPSRC